MKKKKNAQGSSLRSLVLSTCGLDSSGLSYNYLLSFFVPRVQPPKNKSSLSQSRVWHRRTIQSLRNFQLRDMLMSYFYEFG